MKIIISLFILSFGFCVSAKDHLNINKNPEHLVKEVISATLNKISQKEYEIKKNPNIVKNIVNENLMPYVSEKFSTYYLLGNYFRKFKKDEILSLSENFKNYISYAVSDIFKLYTNQKIKYHPYKNDSEKTAIVSFDIIDKSKPKIKVDVILRRMKDDVWLIYDLRFEGISMLSSKRSEYSPILRNDGIDALIEILSKYKDLDIEIK
jgi:phospholipid transport system substrate-binding protein